MENEEAVKQMKIDALRRLRSQNWYEPKTDNPEGLDLDQPANTAQAPNTPPSQPQQAPEATPTVTEAMTNALKQTARKKMLEDLFKNQ
jgi:hypothetical protein